MISNIKEIVERKSVNITGGKNIAEVIYLEFFNEAELI